MPSRGLVEALINLNGFFVETEGERKLGEWSTSVATFEYSVSNISG